MTEPVTEEERRASSPEVLAVLERVRDATAAAGAGNRCLRFENFRDGYALLVPESAGLTAGEVALLESCALILPPPHANGVRVVPAAEYAATFKP